jgi:NarL family two-component system sensor histidine kinase LiaS
MELRLQLSDDGDGFRVDERHDGAGLTGMRERVREMGGELRVLSSPGKGTKIKVTLPRAGLRDTSSSERKPNTERAL